MNLPVDFSLKRWSDAIFEGEHESERWPHQFEEPFCLGVLPGEGIGPDVIAASLLVLRAVEGVSQARFSVEIGGAIGKMAMQTGADPLSSEVVEFCRRIFARRGAILNGPGGDRYVYDLRCEFDLFCKISPLKVDDSLARAGRLRPEHVRGLDLLIVRENVGGIYQGEWRAPVDKAGERHAEQSFSYSSAQTRRILEVGATIAKSRRGGLCVVVKDGGVPTISELWREIAGEVAALAGIEASVVNVDFAAYQLIQNPREFDVIVAPNLCGDILADLGGVLLGSRGVSFSGNFASDGAAVYQTNHGSGYDLVGQNSANPAGQVLSLAMLLRESFGLFREAQLIENAVAGVWRQGYRTADVAQNGCRTVGTREMAELIAAAVTYSNPVATVAGNA